MHTGFSLTNFLVSKPILHWFEYNGEKQNGNFFLRHILGRLIPLILFTPLAALDVLINFGAAVIKGIGTIFGLSTGKDVGWHLIHAMKFLVGLPFGALFGFLVPQSVALWTLGYNAHHDNQDWEILPDDHQILDHYHDQLNKSKRKQNEGNNNKRKQNKGNNKRKQNKGNNNKRKQNEGNNNKQDNKRLDELAPLTLTPFDQPKAIDPVDLQEQELYSSINAPEDFWKPVKKEAPLAVIATSTLPKKYFLGSAGQKFLRDHWFAGSNSRELKAAINLVKAQIKLLEKGCDEENRLFKDFSRSQWVALEKLFSHMKIIIINNPSHFVNQHIYLEPVQRAVPTTFMRYITLAEKIKAHLALERNNFSVQLGQFLDNLQKSMFLQMDLRLKDSWVQLQSSDLSDNPLIPSVFSSMVYRQAVNPGKQSEPQYWYTDKLIIQHVIKRVIASLDQQELNPKDRPVLTDLLQRYFNYLEKVEKGYKVRLPRYYHATNKDGFINILKSGEIQVRHQKMYKGAFVSTKPEKFGPYVFVFGRDIERRTGFALNNANRKENGFAYDMAYWAGFADRLPVIDHQAHDPNSAADPKKWAKHQHACKLSYVFVRERDYNNITVEETRKMLDEDGFNNVHVISAREAKYEEHFTKELLGPALIPKEWNHQNAAKNDLAAAIPGKMLNQYLNKRPANADAAPVEEPEIGDLYRVAPDM